MANNKHQHIVALNFTFFKNIFKLARRIGWSAIQLLLLVLVLVCATALTVGRFLNSFFYSRVLNSVIHFATTDNQHFDAIILSMLQLFVAVIIITISTSLFDLLKYGLAWNWRKHLTLHVMKRYFEKQNYYTILHFEEDSVDNPYGTIFFF